MSPPTPESDQLFCEQPLLLQTYSYARQRLLTRQLDCGDRWNCPACMAKWSRRFMAIVIKPFKEGHYSERDFVWATLTFAKPAPMNVRAAAVKQLRKNVLRTPHTSRTDSRTTYPSVLVWEPTARGRPHLHLITQAPIPPAPKWLNRQSRGAYLSSIESEKYDLNAITDFQNRLESMGWGYVYHCEPLEGPGAAGYLANYLGAQQKSREKWQRPPLTDPVTGYRLRHVSFTRNWPRDRYESKLQEAAIRGRVVRPADGG